MRLITPLVISLLGMALVGCTQAQRIAIRNDLSESIIAEVSIAHPSKLEISSPLNRQHFVTTVQPGQTWRSWRATRSERIDLPSHMVNAGLLVRFRAWGGQPRTYFIGTRENIEVRVEPHPDGHYRVTAPDADGNMVVHKPSDLDWFFGK